MITAAVRTRVEAAEEIALRDYSGVLGRRHLAELGIERGVIARLVRDRRWSVQGRHTIAVHCGPLDERAGFWRAVHEVGGSALVDGPSSLLAAGVTGLTEELAHVSVHMLKRAPEVSGVVVHKVSRRLPRDDMPAGLPRTRPALGALRAAQWAVSDRQAALYLCLPVQQRIVTAGQLRDGLAEYPGRRRRAFVSRIIGDIGDGAQALGELDFGVLCRRRGLPEPERQVLVHARGGRIYLDVRWRCGLVVEIDGTQHYRGLAPVDDLLRQNEVVIGGDAVLRIPLLGLRLDPDAFLDQVVRAHASRCR